jgi:hypothetical protein
MTKPLLVSIDKDLAHPQVSSVQTRQTAKVVQLSVHQLGILNSVHKMKNTTIRPKSQIVCFGLFRKRSRKNNKSKSSQFTHSLSVHHLTQISPGSPYSPLTSKDDTSVSLICKTKEETNQTHKTNQPRIPEAVRRVSQDAHQRDAWRTQVRFRPSDSRK